jgi:hypothetical protein
VKKVEDEMAAKREEERKEKRAQELLEDPVDDEDIAEGEPKTCLEAMQVFDCPERNFCISLISQWLAPKWLVASKAGAIEVWSSCFILSGLVNFGLWRMRIMQCDAFSVVLVSALVCFVGDSDRR